ncbi:putative Cutinase gene palindrome-binding protein [Glarea lozoyensis 74030]|uniref:Putative Cutinase gene palindrome-binding protein n=1 Tax=Glarea lozoyensis (strain ATCC 74030 / MF5533) TaxID=1104152 RepID=H0EYZ4_GLAL7|nr:putative Cutinase gene palindrome-binding protein [Glarea lozoyensis 74030]
MIGLGGVAIGSSVTFSIGVGSLSGEGDRLFHPPRQKDRSRTWIHRDAGAARFGESSAIGMWVVDSKLAPGASSNAGIATKTVNGNDTSMSGMLEDGLLDYHNGLPLTMGVNDLDNGAENRNYSPLDPSTSRSELDQQDGNKQPQSPTDEAAINTVGGGPLPTGWGAPGITPNNGSTLTEFTKRRNWSQKVVEELKDFLHILTPDGRILYLSPSVKALTGYDPDDLVGKFIVDFIHQDDSGIFVREFNESIASGNPLRFFYRFRKKDGAYTIFESHGHPHLTSEAAAFNAGPTNAAGFCRGFFMMARPYPTKNAALLDSFLEHKIENARLMRRIEDLKREEAEDESQQQAWSKKDSISENPSEAAETITGSSVTVSIPQNVTHDALAMPPPAKPNPGLNIALTRQNLEDANLSTRPDSIGDKMARYEANSHREAVEMLTGLRYQEGERSQGISTGDQSPALIRGDAGIAIAVDKDSRANDKRKKIKLPDEYVYTGFA